MAQNARTSLSSPSSLSRTASQQQQQTIAHAWTPAKAIPGIVLKGQHMRKCFDVRKEVALQLIGIKDSLCPCYQVRQPVKVVRHLDLPGPRSPHWLQRWVPALLSRPSPLTAAARQLQGMSCSTSAGLKDLIADSSILMAIQAASGKADLAAGKRYDILLDLAPKALVSGEEWGQRFHSALRL